MSLQPATMAILSSVSGKLSDVIEPRLLATLGMLIASCSLFALSVLASSDVSMYFIAVLVLVGIGFSFFSSPNTNAIMSSVAKENYGLAASTAASTPEILGNLVVSFSFLSQCHLSLAINS